MKLKRFSAFLLALAIILSLLPSVTLVADAVTYVTGSNGYVYNWGKRGTTATFLSPMAEDFYSSNNVTYSSLSSLSGSTTIANVPSSALYKKLQSLMTSNHTTKTNYDGTKNLYAFTDCQSSSKTTLTCLYCGASKSSTWDSGSTWNREHTWPKSKSLNGSTWTPTAYSDETDIMMLRPACPGENSSRSNKAYGSTTTTDYFYPNLGSKDVRGDVARSLLYGYVRWGNTDLTGKSNVIQSKALLLEWMEADPVDTWEMGRNDAVESITGTRNVFIDYPELAFKMFGASVPSGMSTPSGGSSSSGGSSGGSDSTTSGIKASTNNSNYGTVSVSSNVITAHPADGYMVSDTTPYSILSGTCTVTQNGNKFTVIYSGSCSIRINFKKQTTVNIKLSENGTVTQTFTPYTGGSITLPGGSVGVAAEYSFVGWTTSTVAQTATKPSTVYASGSSYKASAAATLYALYSKTQNGTTYYSTTATGCAHSGSTVAVAAKAATCTASGNTAGRYCNDCDAYYNGYSVIPALGHNWVSSGSVQTCSNCGATTGGNATLGGMVTSPKTGTAYKLVLDQKTTGNLLYFSGTTESSTVSYRLATTTDINKAVDVYLESATGGYRLYFMDGGVKTYINMYERTAGSWSGSLELITTTPSNVMTYNTTIDSMVFTADTREYFMGTYGSYETISPSGIYWVTDSNAANLDVTQFPARFYAYSSAVNHEWVAATCTTPKTCSICGETEGNALGHSWQAATCTTPKTCSTCGATSGSALGHSWSGGNCTTDATCSECNATQTAPGHSYQSVVTAPDCANGGYTTYTCTTCGDSYVADKVSALGHTWNTATCETPKTCTVCGETEGAALGHSYQSVVTAPDCANGGYTTYTCTVCGDSYVADKVTALGHTWNAATCTAPKTCTVCNATTGSALGHSYTSQVTAPTCTQAGYTTYECSACGDTYTGNTVAALGHSYAAATCTAPKTCTVCNATTGSALGHNWKAATCTEPMICMDCGVTAGAVKDHDYIDGLCAMCGVCKYGFIYEIINGKLTIVGFDSPEAEEIILPSTLGGYPVTEIADEVFADCDKLSVVIYCGTEQQWHAMEMGDGNEYLTNARLRYHDYQHGFCTICEQAEPKTHEHTWENGVCTGCEQVLTEAIELSGDGKISAFDAQILAEAQAGLRQLTDEQWQALGDLQVSDIIDYILGRF